MTPILHRFTSPTSRAHWILGVALAVLVCGPASAIPAGTSAPKPQEVKTSDNKGTSTTCASPQFTFAGWIGKGEKGFGGWPRQLVLTSTSTPKRNFQIQICQIPTYDASKKTATAPAINKWSYTDTFDGQTNHPGLVEHCYTTNSATNSLAVPENSTTPSDLTKTFAGEVKVDFDADDFATLLAAKGDIYVGYQTDDQCKLDWDQVRVTVIEKNLVKLQAGLLYRLNDSGDWVNSAEAAVRFTSRFTTMLEGEAEFRYDGIAASSQNSNNASSNPTGKAATSTTTQTFNPFSASKGVLDLNLTMAGFILGRGTDSVNWSWVGGGGLTTLRMASTTSTSTTTSGTFAKTAQRYFAGLRLVLPSISGAEGVALSKAHSRIQVSLARDDAWRFTSTSTTGTTTTSTKVDRPNRLVTEGDFDFLPLTTTDKTSVMVGVHLRWDTPASINGGASDLRVSILTAVNFFDLGH